MKTIWVNCLVKNEDKYLWFAVESVVNHVDKILLWDTGSNDKTKQIIDLLQQTYPKKIETKFVRINNPEEFTNLRTEMLNKSICDWVMVLDGDEIWWEEPLKNAIRIISQKGNDLDILVSQYVNPLGDIYHFQNDSAGEYRIGERKGNITYRFFNRKIEGLCLKKPYGSEGYYDGNGKLLQERSELRRTYLDKCFLHMTHLKRSSRTNDSTMQRKGKYRYELGKNAPKDYFYPEVLTKKRSDIIDSPWYVRNIIYLFKSAIIHFPRYIKRVLHV